MNRLFPFSFLLVIIILLLAVSVVSAQEFVTNTPDTPVTVDQPEVATFATSEAAPTAADQTTANSGLYAEFAKIMRDTLMAAIGQMGNIFVLVIGIIAVAAVSIGLPTLFWMYRSTPTVFKPMVKEGIIGAVTTLQSEVDKAAKAAKENDVDWDDEGWAWFQNQLKNNRAKLEAFFASESGQPPQSPTVITG